MCIDYIFKIIELLMCRLCVIGLPVLLVQESVDRMHKPVGHLSR